MVRANRSWADERISATEFGDRRSRCVIGRSKIERKTKPRQMALRLNL